MSIFLCSLLLSCNWSGRKIAFFNSQAVNYVEKKETDSIIIHHSNIKGEISNIGDSPKNFFIQYGKDSLLMIPDFVLSNLYGSILEPYNKLYANYEVFENDFLYNQKYLPQRLNWSYHIKLNKQVLADHRQMSFDDFKKKYLVIEGVDTFLIMNDTTLAYCFDRHGFNSIFNYSNERKTKIVRMAINDNITRK